MSRWAAVTGASSGIGAATAEALARAGFSVVLLARRQDRLQILSEKLKKNFPIEVQTAVLDVTDRKAVESWAAQAPALSVVVNNAGLAKGLDKMQDAKIEDWEAMIDTNVKGLLFLTRAVLPGMIDRNDGHIVNIGSVAGRWVYPGGGVYCASKFAVRALSEGLRIDLMGTAIRVTNIEPGMVPTEFSDVRFESEHRAKAVYKGMQPLTATDIADTILWCLQRPKHVNVQELVIFPTDQATVSLVHRR